MEEDCNAVYVMRGIGSLPLLFHLRFWPHSSRSRNVCRWVDRYLGRGFWQCEPKPPLSLSRDHPSTARGPRHSSPSENWRDPRRVSSRFFFRRAQISINLGKQSSLEPEWTSGRPDFINNGSHPSNARVWSRLRVVLEEAG